MQHTWWYHPLVETRYHGLSQNHMNETIRVQSGKWMQSKRVTHSVENTHKWSKTRILPTKPPLSESRYDIKVNLLKANNNASLMNIKYISLLPQAHYASLMEINHSYTIVQCPGTQQCFPQQRFSAGFTPDSFIRGGEWHRPLYLVGYFSNYR